MTTSFTQLTELRGWDGAPGVQVAHATLAPAAPSMSDGPSSAPSSRDEGDRLLDKPRWPPGRGRSSKRGGATAEAEEGATAEEDERITRAKERNYAISQCSTVEEVRVVPGCEA